MMMLLQESLGSLRGTGRIMKEGQLEELEGEVGFSAPTPPEIKPAASTVEMTCSSSGERGGGQQKVDGGLAEVVVEEEEEKEREVGAQDHIGPNLLSRHHLLDDTGQWTNSTYKMRRRVNASQRTREEGTRLVPPVIPPDTIHTPILPNGHA